MTLLSIVQDALEEQAEQDVPDSIIGNQEPNARLCLALANREGKVLNARAPSGWEATRGEYQFTTEAGKEAYDAPTDFDSLIPYSQWDKLNYWRVNGPATPAFFNYLRSAIVAVGVRRWLYLEDGKFKLHPVPPDDGFPISVFYRKNGWVVQAAATAQAPAGSTNTRWTSDADTSLLSEDLLTMGLKWRFLKAHEMPGWLEAKREYEAEVDKAVARDGGMPVLNMAGNKILPWGMVNVQEGNYG